MHILIDANLPRSLAERIRLLGHFYPPPPSSKGGHRGVGEWTDRPPTPTHWLKQTAFFGPRNLFRRGPTALFWQDSFANPPFESDWFDALHDVMASHFSAPLNS